MALPIQRVVRTDSAWNRYRCSVEDIPIQRGKSIYPRNKLYRFSLEVFSDQAGMDWNRSCYRFSLTL